MTLPPSRFWQDLSTADFEADTSGWVAILPIAATEQHGPHLPTGVDTFLNDDLMALAVDRMPDDLPALVLPTVAVGKSDEHLGFPGTLSVEPRTLLDVLEALGDGVARAGVHKLVIVSSHGGNSEVMGLAGRALRIRHRMLVVPTSWARMGYPDGLFDEAEIAHGIHAGDIETSLMMHLRPHQVQTDKAAAFVPSSMPMESEFDVLRGHGRLAFSWMTADLHASGACGNAANATADKGECAAEFAVGRFLALLGDIHRFDPERLAG